MLHGRNLSSNDRLKSWVKPEETHDFIQGKCRLAVDYGEWFGVGYEGFIRMNLATDPVFVKQAAETIIREAKEIKRKVKIKRLPQ